MQGTPSPSSPSIDTTLPPGKDWLFDYRQVDRARPLADRDEIARWIPHRGHMALLDQVVWVAEDASQGLAVKQIRDDEFWVPGHFPGNALFPGVLQIESGAQLACFMFVIRKSGPKSPVFLRIENAAFRSGVVPGDELILLCKEFKNQKRRFISDVQGLVRDRVAFEARISGMIMDV
ncbi:MAG: 3-hydroxyacyl-ACP dehydratase FabZ family protein [Phycisphaerales bacterium]